MHTTINGCKVKALRRKIIMVLASTLKEDLLISCIAAKIVARI